MTTPTDDHAVEASDLDVSPYLRLPRRSLDDALRERTECVPAAPTMDRAWRPRQPANPPPRRDRQDEIDDRTG